MNLITTKNNFKLGFTLIEMVAVVTIIGLLATAILATFYKVRSNMRDTQRVATITQLQDALEAYYRDEGIYPATEEVEPGSIFKSATIIYIDEVPHNPSPQDDGPCVDNDFIYEQLDSGRSYTITFCLGHQTSNLSAGVNIATPNGIMPDA